MDDIAFLVWMEWDGMGWNGYEKPSLVAYNLQTVSYLTNVIKPKKQTIPNVSWCWTTHEVKWGIVQFTAGQDVDLCHGILNQAVLENTNLRNAQLRSARLFST